MDDEKRRNYESLLLTLVYNFQSSAMIGMGKILNPVTNKVTRNMTEAKFSIDMLEMLSEMTKRNLGEEMTKLMQRILTELRLNYVDEVEKDRKTASQEKEKEEEEEPQKEEEKEQIEKEKKKKEPEKKKKETSNKKKKKNNKES